MLHPASLVTFVADVGFFLLSWAFLTNDLAVFARTSNLKDHENMHKGLRPFRCERCPNTFRRKHDRTRHFQSVHTNLGSPRSTIGRSNKTKVTHIKASPQVE